MNRSNKTTLFSTIIAILIIGLIISLGPANAVTISVNVPSQTLEFNELATFIAKIDLQSSERIPFENLTATIKDNENNVISTCDFDKQGNKLTNCDSNFVSINKIDLSNFNQGDRVGTGFGSNSTHENITATTNFGYGYGFADNNVDNELQYNITWKTPNLLIESKTYTLEIQALSQGTQSSFTYKLQNPQTFKVEMKKPIASLNALSFITKRGDSIQLNASSSYDPNNFDLTKYKIIQNGEVITTSNNPILDLNIDFTGTRNFNLTVTNSINITSLPLEFSITGTTDFKEDNFELNVNRFIDLGEIDFEIISKQNFDRKRVRVKPQIECLNIKFDYIPKFLSTQLILNEADKSYYLNVSRGDFDLKIPYDNNCVFSAILEDTETGEKTTISKDVIFVNDISKLEDNEDTDIGVDNGNELIGYIFSKFNRNFTSGYNTVNFNFKNEGQQEIKTEIKITIPKLSIESYEDIVIDSNTQSKIVIPLFISKNTQPGTYPMRISYRINDGELKTKYGFVEIE